MGLSTFSKFKRAYFVVKRNFKVLEPIDEFLADGWDQILYKGFALTPSDLVVVVGAFRGDSIEAWRRLHDCQVIGVEPVRQFFEKAIHRFENDNKVTIQCYGLGESKQRQNFEISSDATGSFSNSGIGSEIQTVEIQDAKWFMENQIHQQPAIMEINIEGGEYKLLPRILNNVDPSLFPKRILVQFHKFSEEDTLRRDEIKTLLNLNYDLKYDYPWVWECWDLKKS